jgi:hypothetical protein
MPVSPEIPIANFVPPRTSWLGRHIGTVLTAIGLVVGIVTLIELSPRLSAIATAPTSPNDVLGSSTFTISNDGYLKLTGVVASCFLWKVKIDKLAEFGSSMADMFVSPPTSTLRTDEGLTVPCTSEGRARTNIPVHVDADLAIVVYYRAWPFIFYRDHRLFRFVAHTNQQGEVIWNKQPASPLEPDFEKLSNMHHDEFPFSPRRN